MIDYSELKKLAEDATPGPWEAVDYRSYSGNKPHWYLDTSAGKADIADSQDGTIDPNHWDDVRGERDMKFIAASNPSAVLSLICELEKIKADRKACWEEFKVQGRQLDRLKAENEILRKDAERYRQVRAATLKQLDETPDQFDAEFDRQIEAAMSQKE